jgi:phenylalanine-4-hydroxylase
MTNDLIFTGKENLIWHDLFENQIENVEMFACKEFIKGFKILNISNNQLPSLSLVNNKITPRTDWEAIRTKIRYSGALPWYEHFSRKEFIVTNYLRSREEFEFTPEPDMFHDIFGHLSFLVLPEYVELFKMFSEAYLKATEDERNKIGRLAWFSYEFGLIKQRGQIKIFGAGILSSRGETQKVMSGKTKLEKFTVHNVIKHNKAIANFNKTLFVFDSLHALKAELKTFLDPIRKRNKEIVVDQEIKDTEMDLTKY